MFLSNRQIAKNLCLFTLFSSVSVYGATGTSYWFEIKNNTGFVIEAKSHSTENCSFTTGLDAHISPNATGRVYFDTQCDTKASSLSGQEGRYNCAVSIHKAEDGDYTSLCHVHVEGDISFSGNETSGFTCQNSNSALVPTTITDRDLILSCSPTEQSFKNETSASEVYAGEFTVVPK